MAKKFPRLRVPNYWLVGAFWNEDDMTTVFFRRGYWELGYSDREKPGMAKKRDAMRPGDRVAVKGRRGPREKTITIKGFGVVKEVAEDGRVYVDWLVTKLNREVPSRGCYASIHGPYSTETHSKWLGQVFRL